MTTPHEHAEATDVAALTAELRALAADPERMARLGDDEREALRAACERLAHPDRTTKRMYRRARRRREREAAKRADEAVLDRTGIRRARHELVYPTPEPRAASAASHAAASPGELAEPRACYTCKAEYTRVHHFYDALCPACAELNWRKRHQTADMAGRVALLTGGRVKIGYQAGIKLLRAGARLIVTTRFPRDAAQRYAAEPDFEEWRERLEVYGVDLRHTPSVEGLCRHLVERYERLDAIVNNACQTVRRPPGFYKHLMDAERGAVDALPAPLRAVLASHAALVEEGVVQRVGERHEALAGLTASAEMSQVPLVRGDDDDAEHLFPTGALDADLQQVDLRDDNSWRLPLAEVPTVELLEVQLVNAVAPFVLNARLKPLMARTPGDGKHVVNVSAMEGQFYRTFKTDKHPHTNMAKAALNMMTRTSAPDYLADGIHMNSVDTGWITDEDPAHITERKRREHGFHPPLDHVDAAARILDPLFDGLNTGDHVWGQFLKDYAPTNW